MRYRKLGRWPLEVSEIGFGTGDNAGAMVVGSRKAQLDLVASALDAGINVFDTAPDYGRGSAEVNLGQVLRELKTPPGKALVITKVDIFPEDVGRIAERIEISINDSLTRLRRERIDVIMLHNPCWAKRDTRLRYWTALSPQDILGAVLPAFRKARDAGKVGHFAMSCDNSTEPEAAEKVFESGEIALINVVYHLANATAGMALGSVAGAGTREGLLDNYAGLFDAAARHGVHANVIRPLAGGALTSAVAARGRDALHELSQGWFRFAPEIAEPAIRAGQPFRFLDRPGEMTLSEAAFRFALSHPVVASVIGGYGEAAHITEAARASDAGPLAPADMERIRAAQRADPLSAAAQR